MPESDADRVVELEIRLAFQDHVIHELDHFVRALSTRLEKVERELEDLTKSSRTGQLQVGPADDPPPHY